MLIEISEKVCGRCHYLKPASAFGINRRTLCGLKSYCRACVAATTNKEAQRLRGAAHYQRNSEKVRAASAAWAHANRERDRAAKARYKSRHPEKNRAEVARRDALKRAVFVEDVDVEVLYERDNGRCGVCGKQVQRAQRSVDHILPLALGGLHSYANTRLTHWRCNNLRQHRGPAQLRMLG